MENNLIELPNEWQIKVTKENQNMIKDFFTKEELESVRESIIYFNSLLDSF